MKFLNAPKNHNNFVYLGPWSSAITYKAGDIVSKSTYLYYSLSTNTNLDPPANTSDWMVINFVPSNTGTSGQILTKTGALDTNYSWQNPPAATIDKNTTISDWDPTVTYTAGALVKTDFGTIWTSREDGNLNNALPTSEVENAWWWYPILSSNSTGSAGQVLTKNGADWYDYDWENPPAATVDKTVFVADWDPTVTYSAEDTCVQYGIVFVSVADSNLNHAPYTDTSNTYWELSSILPKNKPLLGQTLVHRGPGLRDDMWVNTPATNKELVQKMQNDDMFYNYSQFVYATAMNDSTIALNTTNQQLMITVGAGGYTKSARAHKDISMNATNFMMNVKSLNWYGYPQMHFRLSPTGPAGAMICYRDTESNLAIQRVTNDSGGVTIVVATIPLDGEYYDGLELSCRSYCDLIEIIARFNGEVVGMGRYISGLFFDNDAAINGLGSYSDTVYGNFKGAKLEDYTNIICLGDSNTIGYGGITPKQTYVNKLAAMFFESNVSFVNKGVSGNTVADVAARLSSDVYVNRVTDARNIVNLQIGTNNLGNLHDSPTVVFNQIVNNLLVPLKANGFEVWINTLSVRTDEHNTDVIALNNLLKSLDPTERIIDVNALMTKSDGRPSDDIGILLQADNLHHTALMNTMWAELVAGNIFNPTEIPQSVLLPMWDETKTYYPGDIVFDSYGLAWVASAESTNEIPSADEGFWDLASLAVPLSGTHTTGQVLTRTGNGQLAYEWAEPQKTLYGTGDPPSPVGLTEGTIYIKYI